MLGCLFQPPGYAPKTSGLMYRQVSMNPPSMLISICISTNSSKKTLQGRIQNLLILLHIGVYITSRYQSSGAACSLHFKVLVSTTLLTTRWQATNVRHFTYLFWEEYGVWIVILNLRSERLLGDVILQVRFNVSPCFSTIGCPNESCEEENSNSYPCSVQFFEPGNRKIYVMYKLSLSLFTVITHSAKQLVIQSWGLVSSYLTNNRHINSVIIIENNCMYIHWNMLCMINLYAHKRCDTSVQAYNNTKINTAIFNSVKAVDAF
jgi:hypothetical protein